jgi:N-acetylglutamate synthase-like GNAT family acetyltransferase
VWDPLDPITGIIRQCCDSGKSWVAVDAGEKLVGFVLARKDIHDQKAIALLYIGVSPASRTRKIFSTLLDKLKANGAPLTATVLHSNQSAMADHLAKRGFAEVVRDDKQTKLRWQKPKPTSG